MNILDLSDDIWDYLFRRGYLKIEDMVKLSRVCKILYGISHNVKLFNYPTIDPFNQGQIPTTLNKKCVQGWNNVAFIRCFPTPTYGVTPNHHYIFHTWDECHNVYFHLFSTKWINFNEVIKKYENRVYYYACTFDKVPDYVNIPYLKLAGKPKPIIFGRNVRKVSIGFSDIQDISSYKNLREMTIIFCDLIDLKSLRESKIQKLIIEDSDIQSLEGVQGIKNIVIQGRNRVRDYSPVSKTPYLSILFGNIRHVEFVKETIELNISDCPNFIDISYLTQVPSLKKLTAKSCERVVGFSELRDAGVEVIRN
jgi:hypothetical protein